MCKLCGCTEFIQDGKPVVLERVEELVRELGVTSSTVDDYECVEVMSGMIAPLSAKYAEVVETAAWVEQLHDGMPHYENRSQKYVQAYQDLQSRLPMRGNPNQIAGMYHQIEQLVKELDETDVASLQDPEIRDGVQAVMHVHEDRTRAKRLRDRYGL